MAPLMSVKEIMLKGLQSENKEYLINSFFVKKVSGRGRSVFTKMFFKKGDYVIEYKGICKEYDKNEFLGLHDLYESNGELSYCLEFGFQGKKYFIDATREYEYGIARLINHARNPNLKLFKPLKVETEEMPRIALYAATDIHIGDELFWDYFSSVNPVKCMLDAAKTQLEKIKWIYSRRTKSGKITCQIPNSRPSNRGGICVVCFKNIKKLSNHLINVHTIRDQKERLQMIKNGRTLKQNKSTFDTPKSSRRALNCHLCSRNYLQLSTHLKRVHKMSSKARTNFVEKSRKKALMNESNLRKESVSFSKE